MRRNLYSRLVIALAISAVLLVTVFAPVSIGKAVSNGYAEMIGGASPFMCALALAATIVACAELNVPLCAFGIAYLASEC